MSLNIVRKNSSSPFNQQRSIVDQGGRGGAYEEGGFNPKNVYDNSAILTAIVGFGKSVGDGISTITDQDVNDSDVVRSKRLNEKKTRITKVNTKDPRLVRVNKKINSVEARIKAYNDYKNPTLKSSIKDLTTTKTVTPNQTTINTEKDDE